MPYKQELKKLKFMKEIVILRYEGNRCTNFIFISWNRYKL